MALDDLSVTRISESWSEWKFTLLPLPLFPTLLPRKQKQRISEPKSQLLTTAAAATARHHVDSNVLEQAKWTRQQEWQKELAARS